MHRAETFPYTFNPSNSNYNDLVKAKSLCKNSFWKDIYASLLICRRNILTIHPEEFITLPINGEPQITKNNKAINQYWCEYEMINILLNANGKVKEIDEFYRQKKTHGFELHELKKTLSNFLGSFLCDGRGLESGWLAKTRKSLELYNLYGRMITKKPKGCSYYYDILNANTKKDGWVQPNIKLEAELTEFNNKLFRNSLRSGC